MNEGWIATLSERVGAETDNTVLFRVDGEETSAMTADQRAAYDAVREMLDGAGIEVEELSEAQMDALAEQAGVAVEARRRSGQAEERDGMNHAIDEATSIVTGRSVGEERRRRLQREQERRDLAREIYGNVLQGNFNDVTLQQINKYIDEATPENPFGRRISQRVPQRMERALQGGHRTNAVDALFSRISESERREAGAQLEGNRGARARAKEKKKELLRGWAIATGNWHTDIRDFTDDAEPIAEGKDSKVYRSKDGQHVIKFSKGKKGGKFPSDIDAANLFGYVFPSTSYDIVGYGEIDGEFVTILQQPMVDVSSALTKQERVEYMRSMGFEPINKENTAFSNGQIVVADLQKGNIVRSANGVIQVIDADVKLHTRDIGGQYSYPPASVDTERRLQGEDAPRLMTVYHGSGAVFDEFDHSHMGEGEGEQAYGWGSYVTEVEGIGRTYAEASRKHSFPQVTYKGDTSPANLEGDEIDVARFVMRKILQDMTPTDAFNATREFYQRHLDYYEDKGNHPDYVERYSHLLAAIDSMRAEDFRVEMVGEDTLVHLYTVEIPDDTGENYLNWDKPLTKEQLAMWKQALLSTCKKGKHKEKEKWADDLIRRREAKGDPLDGRAAYYHIDGDRSSKKASVALSKAGFTGIKYPAEFQSGGRSDGVKNYVIFKESDLKITDRVSFLKDGRGVVYGAAMGGRIYLNGARLNPNTPIHEYTHLWDDACRANNPELWKQGVELMKGTSLWNEVRNDPAYAHLQTDDEIASEVHARLTGKDGAALLERLAREAREAKGGVFAKAEQITLVERLKQWLSDFWTWMKDTMTPWTKEEAARVTLEDFVRMPLMDLVKGTRLNSNSGDARFDQLAERERQHKESDAETERDVEQTLLHEAVAHYGLRQLFGKEFDTFLDNVFNNASDEVRRRIVELSKKHNWDFRKATEEYLAGLAESTDFEQARQTSWWQKIKDFFVEMLGKIGFRGVTLTDNELRYVLWRSYENLKGESGVFAEAADIAKQNELGVGEFAEVDDELFRDGDPEVHERVLARDRYDARIKNGWYQTREALQDSMLSLKEGMRLVLGDDMRIEEVAGFENAYLGENRLSSVNKAEADAFARLLFKPMLDEVARLAPTELSRERLVRYMMCKHGLERNVYMARREAEAKLADILSKIEKQLAEEMLTEDERKALLGRIELEKAKYYGVERTLPAEEAQAWYERLTNQAFALSPLWSVSICECLMCILHLPTAVPRT